MPRDWHVADELSDRIVDALNDARQKVVRGEGSPLDLLMGVLLGLMALERTIPGDRPEPLNVLLRQAHFVLTGLKNLNGGESSAGGSS